MFQYQLYKPIIKMLKYCTLRKLLFDVTIRYSSNQNYKKIVIKKHEKNLFYF